MDQLRVNSNDPELAMAILMVEAPPISVFSPGRAKVSLETGWTHLLPPDLTATNLGFVRKVDLVRERSRRNRGPPRWWVKPPEGPGKGKVGENPEKAPDKPKGADPENPTERGNNGDAVPK